jgi:hypothetical protein
MNEDAVIAYLQKQTDWRSPLAVAQEVTRSLKTTASMANPYLYKLQKAGVVERKADANGRNPEWKWIEDKGNKYVQKKDKISSYLLEKSSQEHQGWTELKVMSKDLALPKTELNEILYGWLKEEKVEKMANADGTHPKWRLKPIHESSNLKN